MPSSTHARPMRPQQREDCGCYRCFFQLLVAAAVAAIIIWLTLRPTMPTASIERLTIYALNTTSNNSIYFDLKLNNKNNDEGVYYDALNLTFYVVPDHQSSGSSGDPVANVGFPGFYQGNHKHMHRKATVEAKKGVDWAAVGNGTAVLRAELVTTVRYKVVFWKSGRHRVLVGANLGVNMKGGLVRSRKKGVKLTSGSACVGRDYRGWILVLLMVHLWFVWI